MFYILERAKCEEETDKYLEHVFDYCNMDYQKAYKKQIATNLSMAEISQNIAKKLII